MALGVVVGIVHQSRPDAMLLVSVSAILEGIFVQTRLNATGCDLARCAQRTPVGVGASTPADPGSSFLRLRGATRDRATPGLWLRNPLGSRNSAHAKSRELLWRQIKKAKRCGNVTERFAAAETLLGIAFANPLDFARLLRCERAYSNV